jgi:hypothetical protein
MLSTFAIITKKGYATGLADSDPAKITMRKDQKVGVACDNWKDMDNDKSEKIK